MFLHHRAILTGALVFFAVNGALLSGCQEVAPPSSPEVSRPVPILEIAGSASTSGLRFPRRVQATRRAELAFNVPGRVIQGHGRGPPDRILASAFMHNPKPAPILSVNRLAFADNFE
jgi:hypothetical protein